MAAVIANSANTMIAAPAVAASSFVTAHSVHLLSVALPAVALALFAACADLRARARTRVPVSFRPSRPLCVAASGCGIVATGVHVAVAPEHFHEALAFGVFFVVTAACQLGWSTLMLVRPREWMAFAGALGNAAVVALWLYTRAVAVPIGPEAGRPEEIGGYDVVATVAEIGVVVLTVWIIVNARRSSRSPFADAPGPRGSLASERPLALAEQGNK